MAAVLRKHRGAKSAIAREIGRAASSITLWLQGRYDSELIAGAVRRKIEELTKQD